jgi:opacity protein-like surface antigen
MRQIAGAALASLAMVAILGASPASADDTTAAPETAAASESVAGGGQSPGADARVDGLEALVPELAGHPYTLAPGVRPFQHRLSFSPAFGYLGSERLYALRVAYNPSSWLGYEAAIGHNPGESVAAVLHTLSVVVRRPFAGRFQPYLSGGYGMLLVSAGRSINADPVTKNALTIGGGLEFFIRGDLAIRAEMRGATVFGSQRDHEGVVAYDYLQETIGFAFYRSIAP